MTDTKSFLGGLALGAILTGLAMTPGPPSDGPGVQEIRSEGVQESPAQEQEGPRSYEECADIATEGPQDQVDDRLHACYLEFPMHEDDPRWDCRTMGNRICGPARLPETR